MTHTDGERKAAVNGTPESEVTNESVMAAIGAQALPTPSSNGMLRRRFLAALPVLGLVAESNPSLSAKPGIGGSTTGPGTEPLRAVVFGSCLDTHEHPMLDRTLRLPRDLFIFMGDNVYADKGGIPLMRKKYGLLKRSHFFQGLKSKPVLATWDDHDFGVNDGGAEHALKREAQVEFCDWLDEPEGSPRRQQDGVYQARLFGPAGKRVQVILLDTRYFRSPLKKVAKEQALLGGTAVPTDDVSSTMLGAAQWRWLEQIVLEPADLRLIVSSVQFAPVAHGGECWANFPHEQRRMLRLLKGRRALVLSGDRHWCEYSKMGVHDFTSSAMTQRHPRGTPTPNANRLLPTTYHLPNVGLLSIDWETESITARIYGEDEAAKLELRVPFAELEV